MQRSRRSGGAEGTGEGLDHRFDPAAGVGVERAVEAVQARVNQPGNQPVSVRETSAEG
jgi:hypothetical protein